ncbi:MAG: hypothetical protein ACXVZL_05560 [Gaiellaceae bacterium]|jgi:hypothetical protein
MPAFSPRIAPELVALTERLAADGLPAAEVCRRVGDEAGRLGHTRPSYESVRGIVRRCQEVSR